MIPICNLNEAELQKARIACAYMFSPQLAKSNDFLHELDVDRLKKAFREKSKKYHPDCNRHEHADMAKKRSERFIKIHNSYKTLNAYVYNDIQTLPKRHTDKGKIIAIGGAKGGIGKSLFAANLGVLLSNRGLKTVVVDLDLGGANLHLYLGEKYIHNNINYFLTKKVSSLQETITHTKYGPLLIGGDSSQLGAANISFMQKLKLLKAIQNIDADYIIIDLGGDTSYNIIDFFLAADHGIVMTSCDPASYLDAYCFIKTALYRRLNRLFGPESKRKYPKDDNLKQLIHEFTMSKNSSGIDDIGYFVKKTQRELPGSLPILSEAISTFNPCLVVNKVPSSMNEIPIVKRIQDVSMKKLSIHIRHSGSIPYHPDIELSASNLVPMVATSNRGVLSKKMDHIVANLLCN